MPHCFGAVPRRFPLARLYPPRNFGDVLAYNAIAAKIMMEEGTVIDDLFAFAKPIQAEIQKPNDVHFVDAGSAHFVKVICLAKRN